MGARLKIVLFSILFSFLFPYTTESAYTVETFPTYFGESTQVIGCFNDKTYIARSGEKCTEKGDHNILIPPVSHIDIWKKFYNEAQIINRLAIVNFESGFKTNVGNSIAHGYVQTKRSYNIDPGIESQLTWMSEKQELQRDPGRCGFYWENDNDKDGYRAGEYAVLACLYRFHYHAYKGTWYAQRGIETTLFYKWYFDEIDIPFEEYKEGIYKEIKKEV